jgi:hypothetical protein
LGAWTWVTVAHREAGRGPLRALDTKGAVAVGVRSAMERHRAGASSSLRPAGSRGCCQPLPSGPSSLRGSKGRIWIVVVAGLAGR